MKKYSENIIQISFLTLLLGYTIIWFINNTDIALEVGKIIILGYNGIAAICWVFAYMDATTDDDYYYNTMLLHKEGLGIIPTLFLYLNIPSILVLLLSYLNKTIDEKLNK